MGMDRKVRLEQAPAWESWTKRAAERGQPIQMRMIDGELAFPDETPPESWREVRVAVAGGMATLRRESDGIRVVVWGNATPEMQRGWAVITWALAMAGNGQVETEAGWLTAEEFATQAGI